MGFRNLQFSVLPNQAIAWPRRVPSHTTFLSDSTRTFCHPQQCWPHPAAFGLQSSSDYFDLWCLQIGYSDFATRILHCSGQRLDPSFLPYLQSELTACSELKWKRSSRGKQHFWTAILNHDLFDQWKNIEKELNYKNSFWVTYLSCDEWKKRARITRSVTSFRLLQKNRNWTNNKYAAINLMSCDGNVNVTCIITISLLSPASC